MLTIGIVASRKSASTPAPVSGGLIDIEPSSTGITTDTTFPPITNDFRTFTTTPAVYMDVTASPDSLKSSGKWYWETTVVSTGGGEDNAVGISGSSPVDGPYLGGAIDGWGYYNTGKVYNNSLSSLTLTAFVTSDVLYHKLDLDTGTYEVKINAGSYQTVATGLTGSWQPALTVRNAGEFTTTFYGDEIVGAVPGGYLVYSPTSPYDRIEFDLDNVDFGGMVLSTDGRTFTKNGGSWPAMRTYETAGNSSGKWYWETVIDLAAAGENDAVGISSIAAGTALAGTYLGNGTGHVGQWANGNLYDEGAGAAGNGFLFVTSDIISHKLDMDAGTWSLAKNNGAYQEIVTGLTGTWRPANSGNGQTMNAYLGDLSYAVPSGYSALSTKPV